MVDNLTNEEVLGIGVDLVLIENITKTQKKTKGSFYKRTFTERELKQASLADDEAIYLAERFAVKEAVYKAIAHLTPSGSFDFRIVESLVNEDGLTYINKTPELQKILNEAEVNEILVTVSREGKYVVAIVQANK